MFRAVLAAAFAALVSAKCLPYSATTCYADNKTCDNRYGPTTCYQGACVCLPGYCGDSQGICKGCANWSMDARVASQSAKTGSYQLVPGGWVGERPVWQQVGGAKNLVYYCPKYGNWLITDINPLNNPDCSAGVVSTATPALTPFGVDLWKFWDGGAWKDDVQRTVIALRCNDRLMAPNPLRAIELKAAEEEEELEPIRLESILPPFEEEEELEPIRIEPIMPASAGAFKLFAEREMEEELEPIRIEPIMPAFAFEEEQGAKETKTGLRGGKTITTIAESIAAGGAGEPFALWM